MPDFTENDLAAIERDRDLPPDQPPYDWADPDLWNATDDEGGNISVYGACHVCGAGRKTITATDGASTLTSLVCSADPLHPQ